MQSLSALSLTNAVNDWLANSRNPSILHVFDQVCNLVNEHREVLAVVTPQIGNGPFNVVIENNILFSDYLHSESPISFRKNELQLGDLTISIQNSKLWSARPNWETLHAHRDSIRDQLTLLAINNYKPLLPHALISGLASSVVNRDINSTLKISSQLAGLGNGLTPAGDDVLIGVIYAVRIIHPETQAKKIAEAIASTAIPRTTSLSMAWMKAAGHGEAGEAWHNFFNALLIGDSAYTQFHVAKLLSLGHTSGADALAGFVDSFAAL